MKIFRIRSYEEFLAHSIKNQKLLDDHQIYLKSITPTSREKFAVPGYSYTAGKQVQFIVDYQHSGSKGEINWRERVCCPDTYFNNRMRATFHLFDLEMEAYHDDRLYITEQITPIYTYFADKFPNTVGSEYLGESLAYGSSNEDGVRNETLTALTFPDQSFDRLVSLDVFEHIPDYELSFRECFRVLKAGGRIMWSVPFISAFYENLIRARIENGEVIHIQPPEFHGDPLSQDGVLCFQHFGWKMLDQMRAAGFRDVYALCYQSKEFGYLGRESYMFVAIK